ncbi:microtubule-associated protein TORTIFOLIA1-like [Impatiens glandulifera]|uniref:microtubule-associated protein TORTIFOLIA1-like n=1 Tax=Impatiens glandulifera TaxID=253017 RepID=UPI001FB15360|nr:microtubule-associated protein TORTIFOLIA1-like [Impatiens glandulifera]
MSSQGSKMSRPSSRMHNQSHGTTTTTTPPSRSSLSSHLAMIELKQRILTSLSKLSDRDTYQIAVEDLEKIIQDVSPDALSMLLNCLCDATIDPKPAVKKESLRLLAALTSTHSDSTAAYLTKIISHIVKRLKDSDYGVRDSCRDAIGALSAQYLKGDNSTDNGGLASVVTLFVKPLFEAMSEQNKGVQAGSAICLAKMIESASNPPLASFQKICPRVCKHLNNPNFLAKASLLPVVSSLSQVGAIPSQSLEPLLQSIHDCLGSTEWATRKAAAETLICLASNSSDLVMDTAASTLTVLEACRFDKIKPVRDSVTEALQLWKKMVGKGGDGASDDQKASSHDSETSEAAAAQPGMKDQSERGGSAPSAKDSSRGSSPSDSSSKGKTANILNKAVGILKKKAPTLTDRELNPDFFQKLETRGSGDFPVEVVVPRQHQNQSSTQKPEESEELISTETMRNSMPNEVTANSRVSAIGHSRQQDSDDFARDKLGEERDNGKDSRTNWLAIQRQLLQLERQQSHLMNMLQDFMGGSHDTMLTLESRVRGLERIVEDMARDLSISSSGRRGYEGSSSRLSSNYNGFPPDYPSGKIGWSWGERFSQSRGGRAPPSWRSDGSDAWDFHTHEKNGSKRTLGGRVAPIDARSPRSEHENEQISGRRGWDKGAGPVRLGEGPSARSVWQASKDEATLEAIRVAGEDNVSGRGGVGGGPVIAIPELTAEAMGNDENNNNVPERDPVWTCWSNAMDALHMGDIDLAYNEVLSTGDDLLLVKLMDRTGAVIDQLSNEVAIEVLHAVAQFLQEQNVFDICLYWIQQLTDMVAENGPDVFGIPEEVKREVLVNLQEAASTFDPPEDWEGAAPDQLFVQLASAWGISKQQHK